MSQEVELRIGKQGLAPWCPICRNSGDTWHAEIGVCDTCSSVVGLDDIVPGGASDAKKITQIAPEIMFENGARIMKQARLKDGFLSLLEDVVAFELKCSKADLCKLQDQYGPQYFDHLLKIGYRVKTKGDNVRGGFWCFAVALFSILMTAFLWDRGEAPLIFVLIVSTLLSAIFSFVISILLFGTMSRYFRTCLGKGNEAQTMLEFRAMWKQYHE